MYIECNNVFPGKILFKRIFQIRYIYIALGLSLNDFYRSTCDSYICTYTFSLSFCHIYIPIYPADNTRRPNGYYDDDDGEDGPYASVMYFENSCVVIHSLCGSYSLGGR